MSSQHHLVTNRVRIEMMLKYQPYKFTGTADKIEAMHIRVDSWRNKPPKERQRLIENVRNDANELLRSTKIEYDSSEHWGLDGLFRKMGDGGIPKIP